MSCVNLKTSLLHSGTLAHLHISDLSAALLALRIQSLLECTTRETNRVENRCSYQSSINHRSTDLILRIDFVFWFQNGKK